MRTPSLAMAFLMIVTGVGCVSETTHQKSLDQLGDLRRASADKAESYELSSARTASEIRELRQEQERLTTALLATQQGLAEAQADLQSTQYHLTKEQQTRERAAEQLATLEIQQLPLRAKIRELEARLVSTQVELESARNSHINARARLAVLDQEHTRLTNQLVDSQSTATRTNIALETIRKDLASEQKTRREAEGRLGKLEHKELQLERLGKEVRRERDSLKERVEDLTNGLESAQQAHIAEHTFQNPAKGDIPTPEVAD